MKITDLAFYFSLVRREWSLWKHFAVFFLCVCVYFAGFFFFLLFFFKFKATFLIRFMSYDALHEDVKLHINADLFL